MTKVALIWGAAGGIGRTLARKLKDEGWQVIRVSRQLAGEAQLFIYGAGDIVAEPVGKMTPGTFRRILDANLLGAYYVRPGAVNTSFWRKVPFKMPGSALSPEAVAEKVVEAVNAGHQGVLDL
jgi:NAD(P)-dependent dehydrogenase (short-subunit alcohol dehydrogenase family)